MMDTADVESRARAVELRMGKHRALFGVALTTAATAMLLFIVIAHPFLLLRIAAGFGVVFGAIYVAYWSWWYRYYRSALQDISNPQ